MVVYCDFFQPLAEFHKFKSFSLTCSFNVACSVIFSLYPNLHNSYVNYFIDSFNCKLDTASVPYCPDSCIWKVKDLCTWNSLLIHGFSLVNARLLMTFGTAFYAITLSMKQTVPPLLIITIFLLTLSDLSILGLNLICQQVKCTMQTANRVTTKLEQEKRCLCSCFDEDET